MSQQPPPPSSASSASAERRTRTNRAYKAANYHFPSPGPSDPADGYWDAFAKFPKLGPDHPVADVRKHTLILFRPGAVFRADPDTPFLGHALDTDKLFPKSVVDDLLKRDLRVIHPAFGVTVPIVLPKD